MKNSLYALGASGPITVGLFLFMAMLISGTSNMNKSFDSENFISFVRVKPSSHLETRKRILPKKPPEPKAPPKMPKMAVKQNNTATDNKMAMNIPRLSIPFSMGTGFSISGGTGNASSGGNNDVIPLIRIEPQYPRKAAMAAKEGWVQLNFDINETGNVYNVRIIKSNPRRLFNSSAKRALLQWKYKPKMVDGRPVGRKNLAVQIDFKLQR